MLVQRIEYKCNYHSDSLTFGNSKSSSPTALIEAMKYYSIVEESAQVFPSQVVAVLTHPQQAENDD